MNQELFEEFIDCHVQIKLLKQRADELALQLGFVAKPKGRPKKLAAEALALMNVTLSDEDAEPPRRIRNAGGFSPYDETKRRETLAKRAKYKREHYAKKKKKLEREQSQSDQPQALTPRKRSYKGNLSEKQLLAMRANVAKGRAAQAARKAQAQAS